MSLNWKEIDRLLEELELAGALIQQVYQPSHQSLVFELRTRSASQRMLVALGRYPRLHRLTRSLPNPERPPRFAAFLRAHLRGGRISEARQVAGQRIVKLAVDKGEAPCLLWIRLWPTAANVIATDPSGRILDAFYRRPKRGEVAGGTYDPEGSLAGATADESFEIRDLPGEGDFNSRVEGYFAALEEREEAERLRTSLLAALRSREAAISAQRERLRRQLEDLGDPLRLQQIGDIIMANLHRISPEAEHLEAEDFYNNGSPIVIPLDSRLNGARNAQRYYERASMARRGAERLREELAGLERALVEVEAQRRRVESEESPQELRPMSRLARRRTRRQDGPPGLHYRSAGYRIMVGRTARENEELLRTYVAGNDTWFHVRDWPGAYVFVKAPRGKSIPLEVMLDAANLAVFYSRAREVGHADVYYTQVKYLRRAKEGKPGLVIPAREKNLFVRLEPARLERVRQAQLVE